MSDIEAKKEYLEQVLTDYALFVIEKPDDKNDIVAFLSWMMGRYEK